MTNCFSERIKNPFLNQEDYLPVKKSQTQKKEKLEAACMTEFPAQKEFICVLKKAFFPERTVSLRKT